MKKTSQLNRRTFVGAQLAAISTAGMASTAFAQMPSSGSDRLSAQSFNAIETESPSWVSGNAEQFSTLIGQKFTAQTATGQLLHLKLVAADAGNSGSARPRSLKRAESVSLSFESPFADDLAGKPHQSVWMWHSELGQFEMLVGAVPLRSGGSQIEAVLN